MRKYLICLLCCLLILALVGCKNNEFSEIEATGETNPYLLVEQHDQEGIRRVYYYAFDDDNNVILRRSVFDEVIKYNQNEEPEYELMYDTGGDLLINCHFIYDEQGELVEKKVISYEQNKTYILKRVYDDGNTSKWYEYEDNKIIATETNIYSNDGNIIQTIYCGDNYTQTTEFRYDENNNLIYEATYSQDGALLSEYSYKYWEFNELLEWSKNNYSEKEDIEYLGYWEYNKDNLHLKIFLGQNGLCWIELCDTETNEVFKTLSSFSFVENLNELKEVNIDFNKMTPTNNPLILHKLDSKNKLNVLFQGETIVLEKEENSYTTIIIVVGFILLIGCITIGNIFKKTNVKKKTILESSQNWKCPNCEKEVCCGQEICENCGQIFDWTKLQ